MNDRLARGLFKTLWVLRDYLPEIVVGGGWAPFLYHRYLFRGSDREPVFTRDIDLLVKPVVPVIGNKTIDKVLVEAGLQAVFKSTDHPSLIHYEGQIEGLEVEIEFLTDLTGSETAVVKKVQPDLHAEALRYVSLVVENVTELTIDDFPLAEGNGPMHVRVPTPAAYILHKGLIYRRRIDPRKGDKDLYYLFDILTGCEGYKNAIFQDLVGLSTKHRAWFRRFLGQIAADFADPGSDGVLRVLGQRPANAFPGLDDDQLRQFVFGTFRDASVRLAAINSVHP
jgi:hypothetical protein